MTITGYCENNQIHEKQKQTKPNQYIPYGFHKLTPFSFNMLNNIT